MIASPANYSLASSAVVNPVDHAERYQAAKPGPVTASEEREAFARHALAWDANDAADAAMENHVALSAALNRGDLREAGRILHLARTVTIARRVGVELYGSVDAIKVE